MHRPSTPQGTSNIPPNILNGVPRVEPIVATQAPKLRLPKFDGGLLAPVIFGLCLISLIIGIGLMNDTNISNNAIILAAGGFAALVAIMIIIRPHWGAYALTLIIPLNLSDIFTENGLPGITTPLIMLIGLALAIHLALDFANQKAIFHQKKTELWLIVFALVEGVSIFIAADKAEAWFGILRSFKDFGLLLAIVYTIRTPEQWRKMILIFIVGVTLPSVLAIIKFQLSGVEPAFGGIVSGIYQQVDGVFRLRFGGPIRRPNYYGQLLVSALPLIFYRFFDDKNKLTKAISIGAILAILIGISLTYSRGAIVSFGFLLALVLFERRAKIGWILVLGLVITIAFVVFSPAGYVERIQSLATVFTVREGGETQGDGSFEGRMSEYAAGLLMFREFPLFGVGKGNYNRNYLEYANRTGFTIHTTAREPHSLYIELLAESGLVGFLAAMGAVVACATALQRAYRRVISVAEYKYLSSWIRALQLSLGVYLFSSLFLHGDYIRFLWLYVAFAVSITHVSTRLWQHRSIERPFQV